MIENTGLQCPSINEDGCTSMKKDLHKQPYQHE